MLLHFSHINTVDNVPLLYMPGVNPSTIPSTSWLIKTVIIFLLPFFANTVR